MSINLSNVKNGTTRNVDGIVIHKADGRYTITRPAGTATLWFDKEQGGWQLAIGCDAPIKLDATTKTAFDVAIMEWDLLAAMVAIEEPEAEEAAASEPSKELVHVPATGRELAVRDTEQANEAEAAVDGEEIGQFDWIVETKGGHGPHRLGSYRKMWEALDLAVEVSESKGKRYREDVAVLHALGTNDELGRLRRIMEEAVPQMERMADVICRAVSKQARAEGRHHSHPGALARRGYIRGFGAGVADVLAGRGDRGEWTTPEKEDVDAQLFDPARWLDGHGAGVVFAYGMLSEEAATVRLQNA